MARTLFAPTTLAKAITRLGFLQADPIRAPARAQDLTLRHRVKGYCAGDLERRYAALDIEEDFFVNYGFLPRATHALMHPRTPKTALTAARRQQMDERSLGELISHLRGGTPQWVHLRSGVLARAKGRLANGVVDGQTYYWSATENPVSRRHAPDDAVRLLAPFDPLVWDRRRFEHLWAWAYRFEAYTPAVKRVRGYYALPLLWRDQVIGWGNVSVTGGQMHADSRVGGWRSGGTRRWVLPVR